MATNHISKVDASGSILLTSGDHLLQVKSVANVNNRDKGPAQVFNSGLTGNVYAAWKGAVQALDAVIPPVVPATTGGGGSGGNSPGRYIPEFRAGPRPTGEPGKTQNKTKDDLKRAAKRIQRLM